MTLPASGPLSLGGSASNSINNEFGYGANLGAYRNKLYTNAAGTTTSAFPFAPNSISIPSGTGYTFYNSRKIPSGSVMYSPGSGTFTIPAYNSITVTALGSGGGGGGGGGGTDNTACPGKNGTAGTASSYSTTFGNTGDAWRIESLPGGYGTGGGGANGGGNGVLVGGNYNGGNAGTGGSPGSGYTAGSGGNGGSGQSKTITLSNPLLGGSGPNPATVIAYYVASKGTGGAGGTGSKVTAFLTCDNDGGRNGGAGVVGGDGSITISWS